MIFDILDNKRFISTAEILDGIERYDNETSKSESNQKVNDKVQLSADTLEANVGN